MREIRTSSLSQSQLDVLSSVGQDLSTLELKITNSSYKLHRLGNLRSLTSLSMSGMNYRQSRMGVALVALAPQLQKLCFDHVNGLDTGDIRSIGQHCKVLGKLEEVSKSPFLIYICRAPDSVQLHRSKKHF